MSLEEALAENTAAMNALTAALGAKGGSPAAVVPAARRGPGRPPAVTLDEVKAIAERVRDEKGQPAAVALIREHGADRLVNLDKAKYSAFIAAAEVLLNTEDQVGDEAEL